MKRLISLMVVAFVACGLASLAAGAPPSRFHEVVPVTTVYQPCGAVESVTYTVDGTRYFDNEGNLTRTVLHVSFEGTMTVPRTGETVRNDGRQKIVLRPDGTFEFSRVSFNIHIPGEGLKLLEAGRIVFDGEGNVLKQSAKTSADLAAKVCAALG